MGDHSTRFAGAIPEEYDRRIGPSMFADHAEFLARRVAANRPGRILEIAAGTGIVTRRLRDLLPAAEITATDLAAAMLAVARKKFRDDEKVTFREADATNLPFPNASFDIMACQFGVMFFPDRDKSYREAHRVLAPGGRYVFNVWDSYRHNSFGRIAHEVVAGFFPADPPQFFSVAFGHSAIDPTKESLLGAGFVDIRIDVVAFEKDIPDPENFAFGLVFGLPIIEQVRSRGGVDADEVARALGAALRRERGATGRIPFQAIVFDARRP
jgi:SAM-dependent methyltransferase